MLNDVHRMVRGMCVVACVLLLSALHSSTANQSTGNGASLREGGRQWVRKHTYRRVIEHVTAERPVLAAGQVSRPDLDVDVDTAASTEPHMHTRAIEPGAPAPRAAPPQSSTHVPADAGTPATSTPTRPQEKAEHVEQAEQAEHANDPEKLRLALRSRQLARAQDRAQDTKMQDISPAHVKMAVLQTAAAAQRRDALVAAQERYIMLQYRRTAQQRRGDTGAEPKSPSDDGRAKDIEAGGGKDGAGMYSQDTQPVDAADFHAAFHAFVGTAITYLVPAIASKQELDASLTMLQDKAGAAGMAQLQVILDDAESAATSRIATDERLGVLAAAVSEISDAVTGTQSSTFCLQC